MNRKKSGGVVVICLIIIIVNFKELSTEGEIKLPDYHQETTSSVMSTCNSTFSTSASNMRY